MMTIRTEDGVYRVKVYEAVVKGTPLPPSSEPESVRVLIKEFQALGLDISVLSENGKLIDMKEIEAMDEEGFTSVEDFENSIQLVKEETSDKENLEDSKLEDTDLDELEEDSIDDDEDKEAM